MDTMLWNVKKREKAKKGKDERKDYSYIVKERSSIEIMQEKDDIKRQENNNKIPLSSFFFFLQCLQAMAIDHNDILAVIGDNFQLQDHVTVLLLYN